MKRLLFAALALCTTAIHAAPPADSADRHRQFERGLIRPVLVDGESPALKPLAARMTELKVPGVSVAVFREGKIEWARGCGVKAPGGDPVTESTLFQAASISKPVFALAVMRLVDEGKLKLDANVRLDVRFGDGGRIDGAKLLEN